MSQRKQYLLEIHRIAESILSDKPDAVILWPMEGMPEIVGKDFVIFTALKGEPITKSFEDLSDEVLENLYGFLEGAEKMHMQTTTLKELEPATEKSWLIEPEPIEGVDKVVIGHIGVALDAQTEQGQAMSVIFISGDQTWATLTIYVKENVNTKFSAKSDLSRISAKILEISQKL